MIDQFWAKTQNALPFSHLFHSRSDKTNFEVFFCRHQQGQFCCSLAVMLLCLTNEWRVLDTLSITVLSLQENWNLFTNRNLFTNINLCMIPRSFGQNHSMYIIVWQWTPEHLFQNQNIESTKQSWPVPWPNFWENNKVKIVQADATWLYMCLSWYVFQICQPNNHTITQKFSFLQH